MKLWLKRIGYILGAIIALILIVVSVVYGMSDSRVRRTYAVADESHISMDVIDRPRPVHCILG